MRNGGSRPGSPPKSSPIDDLELRLIRGDKDNFLIVRRGELQVQMGISRVADGSYAGILSRRGINILSASTKAAFVARVEALPLEERPAIEGGGWTEDQIALADGSLFHAADDPPREVVFLTDPHKCGQRGTLQGWIDGVASPLIGQRLAFFLLMVALAAPFLRLVRRSNFGFEIIGPGGKGKSTLQYLMSSIWGNPDENSGHPYWITCNATLNGLETAMAAHNDAPMIMDEMATYLSSANKAQNAANLRSLVFLLTGGREKQRHQTDPERYKYIFVTSANRRTVSFGPSGSDPFRGPMADRLMTLTIGQSAYGTFEFLPSGFESGAQLAHSLEAAAVANHGVAVRALMTRLVEDVHADRAGLVRWIEGRRDFFIHRAQVNENDGSAYRVANAFGLVYAAARYATDAGILPRRANLFAAAMYCYGLHRAATAENRPFAERLAEYAERDDIIQLPHTSSRVTEEQYQQAAGFVRPNKKGERELLIPQEVFHSGFYDYEELFKDPDVLYLMNKEGDRINPHREVRDDHPAERIYAFVNRKVR